MIDLNYIIYGKTKKRKSSSSKGLLDLNVMNTAPRRVPKRNNTMGGLSLNNIMPLRKKPIGVGVQTKAQRRVPKKSFFGDWDRDGVINRLDCAPRNPKHHAKFYHGTSSLFSHDIQREGLKPSKQLPSAHKMSIHTDRDYTYFFKEPQHAKTWGRVVTNVVGMGKPAVLEVDVDESKVERDLKMPFGESYKHEGEIKPDKIKVYDTELNPPADEVEETIQDDDFENEED